MGNWKTYCFDQVRLKAEVG